MTMPVSTQTIFTLYIIKGQGNSPGTAKFAPYVVMPLIRGFKMVRISRKLLEVERGSLTTYTQIFKALAVL
jgi:hypothetical protein